MGERAAVAEADERVHDRGRMDDDLDAIVRKAEEEVRLDQLEPLVRERRGVDGDLRAHAPGRVRERLLDRDVLELGARAAAERAAGRGQHERVDGLRCAAFEALEGGAVLAVDGQQQPSAPLPRAQRELAGRDEALLVRERERRRRARAPTGSRRSRRSRRRRSGRRPARPPRAAPSGRRRPARVRRRARRPARSRSVEPEASATELELWMRADDLDRLPADRAGRAEQRDSLHAGV